MDEMKKAQIKRDLKDILVKYNVKTLGSDLDKPTVRKKTKKKKKQGHLNLDIYDIEKLFLIFQVC